MAELAVPDEEQALLTLNSYSRRQRPASSSAPSPHANDWMAEAQRLAGLGSWSLNLTTNVFDLSTEAYRIFELDPANSEVGYDDLLHAVHPGDRQRVRRAHADSRREGNPFDIVHRVPLRNGTVKFVHQRGQTFFNQGGAPLRLVGTAMDVTEQQRMLAEQVSMERRKARMEVVSGINHNLNNLLNGLLGPAALLKASAQSAENRRWVDIIHATAEKTAALLQRLNDVVSESEENTQLVDVNVNLQESLHRARQRCLEAQRHGDSEIKLLVDLQPVPLVTAEPAELEAVLECLLANAVEAMPQGGTLAVGSRHVNDRVEITVRDTGKGMNDAAKRRVFEPFFTTKLETGAGLSLYRAHKSINDWGGTIEVRSAPEEGSTFTLRLPEGARHQGGAS